MSDLDLVRKLLKEQNKPFIPRKRYVALPISFYEAMSEEQRANLWETYASITIYFVKNYYQKNQKLYKLIKGGKLRRVSK